MPESIISNNLNKELLGKLNNICIPRDRLTVMFSVSDNYRNYAVEINRNWAVPLLPEVRHYLFKRKSHLHPWYFDGDIEETAQ